MRRPGKSSGPSYLVEGGQRLEVVVLAEVHDQGEQTEHLSVEAELQEQPVVVLAHAVVDPDRREGSDASGSHEYIDTELGRAALCYCAPHTWNLLQQICKRSYPHEFR